MPTATILAHTPQAIANNNQEVWYVLFAKPKRYIRFLGMFFQSILECTHTKTRARVYTLCLGQNYLALKWRTMETTLYQELENVDLTQYLLSK